MTQSANSQTSQPFYISLFSWIVTLLIPVILTLTFVRIMLSPVYINLEYRMPGFPDDLYGFSQVDRLYWADIARLYLLNSADISFLGDLRFSNGQSVYNQRELHHMEDVKSVVQVAIYIWYASIIGLLIIGLWAKLKGWMDVYKHGVGRGGWLTVFLLGSILLLVVISFGFVFVAFHNVFFQAGTWQFEFSDTLIRLFPERFWRDTFIWVGGFTLASGLTLAFVFGRSQK